MARGYGLILASMNVLVLMLGLFYGQGLWLDSG